MMRLSRLVDAGPLQQPMSTIPFNIHLLITCEYFGKSLYEKSLFAISLVGTLSIRAIVFIIVYTQYAGSQHLAD